MNREHAYKGYKVNAGTSEVTFNFYGFNVISEAVINTLTAPTTNSPDGTTYDGDEAGIATTRPVGYYPIRGSAIDLTSGSVILWKE